MTLRVDAKQGTVFKGGYETSLHFDNYKCTLCIDVYKYSRTLNYDCTWNHDGKF